MSRQVNRPLVALCAGLLVVFSVAAQPPLPLPTDDTYFAEPEPVRRWLDEVRAQRQMRRERRRAVQEAIQARRRWTDPWGAARQEFREQETQRRHDAFLEHIDRDRAAFRNQVPWGFPPDPRPGAPSPAPAPSLGSSAEVTAETSGQAASRTPAYPLPGWDNHWYYRGF